MSGKGEWRAEMHQLAQDRLNRGLPSWAATLRLKDFYHNDLLTFEEKREKIVFRIKQLALYKAAERTIEDPSLKGWRDAKRFLGLIKELAGSDAEDFDELFGQFYDWADVNRIWVETF